MKKTIIGMAIVMLCICVCAVDAQGVQYLIPGGQSIGMELFDGTVIVAELDENLGQNAKNAGLCPGDQILAVNETAVHSAEDLRNALHASNGCVTLLVQRSGKRLQLQMTPQITADGPVLGIYLKQGITGIGTVTYFDPDSLCFGALGHGVNNSSGQLLPMERGTVYKAGILAVTMGRVGAPGQLRGTVTDRQPIGSLEKNTAQGVFGKANHSFNGQAIPVAEADAVHAGPATILSTVSGEGVQEYSVEILKIYPKSRQAGRNLMLKITDPALLEATGGIVQGMSGSPIIQDGKLIGAVTHVLVNDPTRGYGIFIENMLDAAA